jgi:hypothetical protein
MKIKWEIFLPTWLIIFLLAPSILIHGLFMMTIPSPGYRSDVSLFLPFGAIYFMDDLWRMLVRGEFVSALVIFIALILPILIYTFPITLAIHHVLRRLVFDRRADV